MRTYEDVFVEEIVLLRRGSATTMLKAAIVVGVILLVAAFYIFVRPFMPALSAIAVYFAILGWHYTRVEYEYSFASTSFTEGELDVIKIMGKRKRKHLANIKTKSITEFTPLRGDYSRDKQAVRATGIAEDGAANYLLRAESGNTILFTPSERLAEAITKFLPRGAVKS